MPKSQKLPNHRRSISSRSTVINQFQRPATCVNWFCTLVLPLFKRQYLPCSSCNDRIDRAVGDNGLIASAEYSGSTVRTETPRMRDDAVSAIKATERIGCFYHDNRWPVATENARTAALCPAVPTRGAHVTRIHCVNRSA